ncbi:hypothetical protein BVX97_04235 [bacterium E08(2017)]|nr:hypothetical protein BVX97_04235 [bacterium E08(2017)]
MITVNADDFGFSESINSAIVDSLQSNICTTTTIMATADRFNQACSLAKENNFTDKVGIHFVLIDQKPLTHSIRKYPLFCRDDGSFLEHRDNRIFKLTKVEEEAVEAEMKAQVARCRDNGIPISHADSHQHMHEEWALLPVFLKVCLDENIPYLRLARNCGRITRQVKRMYRNIVNERIKSAGLARTDYFGSTADYQYLVEHSEDVLQSKSMEVMVHPDYRDGKIIDQWGDMDLGLLTDIVNPS